ncbi:ABC transporter substrate-binding protein [Nocardiopsis sp. CNT-189]|uniref:ABC transporter substrate-binding protein n=1 Tax=Nocardiopsis oceanisediminis TaxID=2816862 RepID=UPI003B33F93E
MHQESPIPSPAGRRAVRRTAPALACTALLAAAGCGGGGEPAGQAAPDEGYPVTVQECDREVTVDAPPERAVTLNQHTTEIMLALGLEDRMVGTAYLDDAVLPEYADAYEAVPVLAEQYPSFEDLLAAEPDFAYAGFASSAFAEDEGRGREALEDAGMTTYASIEQCADQVTMETVATEITNIGKIFGVEDRAEELVAGIEEQVAGVEKALEGTEPVDVLVVDSIDGTVFTSGGAGIGTEIIAHAGGRNVFDDLDKVFADVSIEQAADREPDAILIYDYGEVSAEEKKEAVLADPTLAGTPAVEEERFAVLPLTSSVVGNRVGGAVEEVAEQLHPDAF